MRYPAHVAVGSTSDVLRRIHEPGINLAIWERTMDAPLREAVRAVAARISTWRLLPHGNTEPMSPEEAWAAFTIAPPHGLKRPDAAPLLDDIRTNIRLFRSVTMPLRMTLSWRAERGIRSESWHVDRLRFRELCFYDGATTLGLSNAGAIVSPDDVLTYRKRLFARRWCLPPGSVCIFRGLDPLNACEPFVHSEPTGDSTRLLMVATG